jgi:hypothetical protein
MRRHLSAPLIISIIALIGAWGGPAMARALIDSASVKDRSLKGRDIASSTINSRIVTGLTGNDIVPDSLQGSDIQERTLNKVASAVAADTVSGVTIEPFSYADPEGKSAIFFDKAGLRVAGFCNSGTLEATASATVDNAIVRNTTSTPGVIPVTVADNDFDEGEQISLIPANTNDSAGQLTFFEPDGGSVIVQYLAASALPIETGHQCLVSGVAIRTDG